MKALAPAFRFSPAARSRVDRLRLNIDTVGLLLVRYFTPLVHVGPWPLLMSIYNAMAWATVLTVDSTRLPEHSSTRVKQRQSWVFAAKVAPLLFTGCLGAAVLFRVPVHLPRLVVSSLPLMLLSAYMDELLFRNVLQPRLRQMGLSRWMAVLTQSALFAATFAFVHASIGVVVCAFFLGNTNGWLVYKFRSLWAAFVLSLLWHLFLTS